MATEQSLHILTQLSVQGAYGSVVDRCREHLDRLDEASLALVASAALEVQDEEILDSAVELLCWRAPDAPVTVHIELCRAVHRNDRAAVAEAQRRVRDYAGLIHHPVMRAAAGLHLRRHAWRDLYDLLTRCRDAVETLPPALMRAQATLHLRRREYTEAISDAKDAYALASPEDKLVSGVLLARCFERRGLTDRAALTYKQCLWNAAADRRYHYRAALAAVKVRRYPLARSFMQKATSAGASGPWMEWIRGHVKFKFQGPDTAQEIFQKLCEREPDNVAFATAWLDAFDAEQPPSRTLAHVDRMLETIDSPELRVRRTDLLLAVGRFEDARREIDAALASFPDSQAVMDMRDRLSAPNVPRIQDDQVTIDHKSNEHMLGRRYQAQEPAATETADGPPPVAEWPACFQPSASQGKAAPQPSFLTGFGTQMRVMNALLLREIQTRYGQAKLGYLWALIEPALHMAAFYTLWSFRGRTTMDGLPLELFLMTGFLPYFAFSQTYGSCLGAARNGESLLAHPTVTTFDLLFVSEILEGLTRFTVFVLYLGLAWLAGIDFAILEPGEIFVAFGILWAIGLGLGFVVESFSSIVITLPKVMTMVTRFLYFTSGVMFPITTMPPSIQELLFYNPLVHLIATLRYGFVETPPLQAITLTYPFFIMVGFLSFGLIAMRALHRRITSA